ncbi:DUF29 domain-containing protein [Verrucomicrobium sp. 3C]|uniref:DUF29 domain-containing protein n=1 Tax=Verrucomicrobium sp. 3C TaxID=1134055 RepID=UPI000374F922|nr:DUF29 domain-containing protein [Verrucomicrobium sp. 3C]
MAVERAVFPLARLLAQHDRDCMTTKEFYERDLYAWTQETARLLREGRFDKLDIKNLIEEVEDLGSSQWSRLESRLETLMEHTFSISRI